jgi:hypothetical protein
MVVKRTSWLSVTPEPEQELPRSVATLKAGGPPAQATIVAERERVERLVLHGTQRQWLDYLHGVVALIERAGLPRDPVLATARDRALSVVVNHHNLLLGLGGRAAHLTAGDRARLAELAGEISPHIATEPIGDFPRPGAV